MRCKVGDLVVYVGRIRSSLGRTAIIIERRDHRGRIAWMLDRPIVDPEPPEHPDGRWVWDSVLRPLRDNDGQDEMLRIAGLPQQHPKEPA